MTDSDRLFEIAENAPYRSCGCTRGKLKRMGDMTELELPFHRKQLSIGTWCTGCGKKDRFCITTAPNDTLRELYNKFLSMSKKRVVQK